MRLALYLSVAFTLDFLKDEFAAIDVFDRKKRGVDVARLQRDTGKLCIIKHDYSRILPAAQWNERLGGK